MASRNMELTGFLKASGGEKGWLGKKDSACLRWLDGEVSLRKKIVVF